MISSSKNHQNKLKLPIIFNFICKALILNFNFTKIFLSKKKKSLWQFKRLSFLCGFYGSTSFDHSCIMVYICVGRLVINMLFACLLFKFSLCESVSLGWHFDDINVTVTFNLDHTTYIVIASEPHNTSILVVAWSKFNVTVTLMSPKCHPLVWDHLNVFYSLAIGLLGLFILYERQRRYWMFS